MLSRAVLLLVVAAMAGSQLSAEDWPPVSEAERTLERLEWYPSAPAVTLRPDAHQGHVVSGRGFHPDQDPHRRGR